MAVNCPSCKEQIEIPRQNLSASGPGKSSLAISAKRDGVGAVSQQLVPMGERSGGLTRIAATENVSCEPKKSRVPSWSWEGRFVSSY